MDRIENYEVRGCIKFLISPPGWGGGLEFIKFTGKNIKWGRGRKFLERKLRFRKLGWGRISSFEKLITPPAIRCASVSGRGASPPSTEPFPEPRAR